MFFKFFAFLTFLSSTTSAIHIHCNFSNKNFYEIGTAYNCLVTSMNFTGHPTYITSNSGAHLSGKSNSDVKIVVFKDPHCQTFNLTFIPKGILNFFPNIFSLEFRHCAFEFLNGDELNEYPKILYWVLTNSKIKRIPGEFFTATRQIKFIDFWHNKIENVGESLMDGLESLTKVHFQNNSCINSNAANRTQIPTLINDLRMKCPDIVEQPPKCEILNLNNFICDLDEKVESLKNRVKILENDKEILEVKVENLERKNENFEEKIKELEEINENLVAGHENLKNLIFDVKNENQEIRGVLEQLEEMIIELTIRPCSC